MRKRGPKPADDPAFLQQFLPHLVKLRQILPFVAEESIHSPPSTIGLDVTKGSQCKIPCVPVLYGELRVKSVFLCSFYFSNVAPK